MKKHSIEDFRDQLTYHIDYTANVNKTFRRQFHDLYMGGLATADELALLTLINLNPELSQVQMGDILFKGKAHIGKMLNNMANKEWIIRKEKEDKNRIENTITPKGKKALQKLLKQFSLHIIPKMEQEFSPEESRQFISYLERYRNVLASVLKVKLK